MIKECLCYQRKISNEDFKELNSYNVSLCIPCIPRDKNKLERLMKSVKSQTLKPYEVVISLSGEEYTNNYFKYKLQNIAGVPVKIIYSKDKKTASQNRNIASENAIGDIISYIDADDIMKNNRIKRIVSIFKKYNCNAVLHSYEFTLDTNKNSNTKIKIYEGKYMYKISKELKTLHLWIKNENKIHHGHISIKRSVFNHIKFNTSEQYRRGQDSRFVRDIIEFYGNNNKTIVFTNEKLSYYIPSASQNN